MKGKMTLLAGVAAATLALATAVDAGAATRRAAPKASAANRANAPAITVLTGPSSGLYYPIGNAFSKYFGEMGYKSSSMATGATAANIKAILNDNGNIAIAMADSVIQAVEAYGAYEGRPPAADLRAMMGLWPNVVQIVATEDSGVRSFRDLKGKCVSVGAPNSGVELNARMIFEAHGMSYQDVRKQNTPYGEAMDRMKRGRCDAAFVTSGLGNAAIKDLGAAKKIVFVPVEGEALNALRSKHPFFINWTIPKDAYGTDRDTATAAVMNILLVSKDLPDSVVYDLLEGIYSPSGLRAIGAAHPTAQREIRLDTALRGIRGTSVKLHPGAERFYRDKKVR